MINIFSTFCNIFSTFCVCTERSELYRAKLQTRIRGKDETLPELAQSIKKLTRLAYPIAHSTLISVLSLEHFIDAIPDG
jgi:hypothetical protein